jgi:DNA polymerase I-like protein with 3'-5' exonuclease and polymerase domains
VDGWAGYFPVAHGGGGNLDKRLVERWVKDVLATPADKIMHNAAYDLGWLRATGFEVNGNIYDTMLAAPVLDENRFAYSLNSLGFDYLKEIKSEQGLKESAADFGVHPKKELWKLPAMHVGDYAEQDAALTLKLWHHFKALLAKEEVESIFQLESEVLPVLVDITLKGISFDRAKCEMHMRDMRTKETEILKFLKSQAGMQVDIWAAHSIAAAFDRLGIQYPKTAQGAPSFTKSFLDTHEHPMAKMILEARELNKTHGTFLEPYLKHSARDGRIHTHFNQMRNEDGGTVTSSRCPRATRSSAPWCGACSCPRTARCGRPTTSAPKSRACWCTTPPCWACPGQRRWLRPTATTPTRTSTRWLPTWPASNARLPRRSAWA